MGTENFNINNKIWMKIKISINNNLIKSFVFPSNVNNRTTILTVSRTA